MNVKLANLATEYGIENLRLFFPAYLRDGFMGLVVISTSNRPVIVEGRICESARPNRTVANDYKFIAKPLNESYAYEDYYNADFENLSQQYPDRYFVMVGDEKIVLGFQPVAQTAA